jgi:hypothetical protein
MQVVAGYQLRTATDNDNTFFNTEFAEVRRTDFVCYHNNKKSALQGGIDRCVRFEHQAPGAYDGRVGPVFWEPTLPCRLNPD